MFQNPYMKESFFIKIETIHLPDAGTTENVSSYLSSYTFKYISVILSQRMLTIYAIEVATLLLRPI